MNINESLLNKLKEIRALNEAVSDNFSFNTFGDDEPEDFSFEYQNFGEHGVKPDIEFEDGSESYEWGKPYSEIITTENGEQFQIWSAFNNNINDKQVFFVVDIGTQYIKFGPTYNFEEAQEYLEKISTESSNLIEENLDFEDDYEPVKISKDGRITLGQTHNKYLPYIIVFNNRPNSNKCFATYGAALNCFNTLNNQFNEAYSNNVEDDYEQIRTEFGDDVYDALGEYLNDYAYNLGSILYNEYEWDQFAKWLNDTKGIKLDYAVMVDPENEVVCNGNGCYQCDDSISSNMEDDINLDQYFESKDESFNALVASDDSDLKESKPNKSKYNSNKQISTQPTEDENDIFYNNDELISKYKQWREFRARDVLDEDVVKQGNSWVNKGENGTHGKFKTKKDAQKQCAAIYASGWKG